MLLPSLPRQFCRIATTAFRPSIPSASHRLPLRRLSTTVHNQTCLYRRNTHTSFMTPRLRQFSTTTTLGHGHVHKPKPGEEIKVTFITKENEEFTYDVSAEDNLLDIAQANDLEMEGACGGSCACSTCHVIVEDQEYYDKIAEPDDDENDMLDLAFGLTETSRLGCQVKMSKDLDGLRVRLPSMTRNLQAGDFKGKA